MTIADLKIKYFLIIFKNDNKMIVIINKTKLVRYWKHVIKKKND